MTGQVYALKAFGEAKEKLDVELPDGCTFLNGADSEPDGRWTLEWAFRAPSEELAKAAAEEIVAEAGWEYGPVHGWDLREVVPHLVVEPPA